MATQNRKPGISNAENRQVHRPREPPEDDREGDQIGRRGHPLYGVVVDAGVGIGADAAGAVDEAADVLRNALVRIVGFAAAERELIVHRVQEPAGGVGGRHPAPPLQHEIQRDVELDQEGQDRDRHQRREDSEQLVPEGDPMGFVRNLDGVAEIPVEEIQPNAQRHLELVDQNQEKDVDARIEALAQDRRGQRPGTDGDRRLRGEERVGDRRHPAHEGKMRDGEDDEAEQRRRQRQVTGQAIGGVILRPITEKRGEIGEAEQHRLEGEEIGEQRQEGRKPPSRP